MQKYKMRLCDKAAVLGMKVELEHLKTVKEQMQERNFDAGCLGSFFHGYFKATESHIEWLSGFIKSYENMFQEEST